MRGYPFLNQKVRNHPFKIVFKYFIKIIISIIIFLNLSCSRKLEVYIVKTDSESLLMRFEYDYNKKNSNESSSEKIVKRELAIDDQIFLLLSPDTISIPVEKIEIITANDTITILSKDFKRIAKVNGGINFVTKVGNSRYKINVDKSTLLKYKAYRNKSSCHEIMN